ncbi:RING-H2 finger protein ATL14 [Ziziphus jujuba]|uniref:RING-H2 finger protein ATL14 n=1 Tax=Ziziphus jujuba TaxID=326968 RepID=A0A6P3ZTW5_ZIZJJ|nr:RING-H2 finger protein ATL14 [Ziziphus jujuba]
MATILLAILLVFLAVIVLLMGFGFLFTLYACIAEALVDALAVERPSRENKSMSKDEIEKLPQYDYVAKATTTSTSTSDLVADQCAICLETFKMGEKCRLLPSCNPSFHAHCVDEWLLQTPIYPICRTSVDSQ